MRILSDFFRETTSPGLLVYAEYVAANLPTGRDTQDTLRQEIERGHRAVSLILPAPEFLALAAGVDDSCDWQRNPTLVKEYLSGLENSGIGIENQLALQFLPATVFGGAFKRGETFLAGAPEALQRISNEEGDLLRAYLRSRANTLRSNEELRRSFPHTVRG